MTETKKRVRVNWEKAAALWGVASDGEIAAKLGTTDANVRMHRKRHKIPATLGRGRQESEGWEHAPDSSDVVDVANAVGVTSEAVRKRRRAQGLPTSYPTTRRVRFEDWHLADDLWGRASDGEIAAKLGISSDSVKQFRRKHGIAAALPQGGTRNTKGT